MLNSPTVWIIVITALISYRCFKDRVLFSKLLFNPYILNNNREHYRIISHGFVHADTNHLFFNMFSLFLFGRIVESSYEQIFGANSLLYFIILYLGGIVVSSIKSFIQHKDNPGYSAVGASGAVSAVVFAFILLNPMTKLGFFIIPPFIPGWIFGFIYLAYSQFMAKKQLDNIGHDAHFWGAVYGFIFTILLEPSLFSRFIDKIVS